ncbi:MAG: hypothetical protein V4543_00720 [Bacteroidota bacterium]
MPTRLLTFSFPVTDEPSSFSIPVPGDLRTITDICVLTSAAINVPIGALYNATTRNNVTKSLKAFKRRCEREGYWGKQKLIYTRERPSLPDEQVQIPVKGSVIGQLSIKSHERSQLFFSQPILPDKFILTGSQGAPPLTRDVFVFNRYRQENDKFLPVSVDGSTVEISGFYRPTTFGETLHEVDDTSAGNSHPVPGMLKIHLRYKTY